ncbi:hypothetical protein F1188_16145 [Roseospira marina]|uniref:Uncharacterized protein n=1 Tax=Roseospira marina TaxID=140057 RepID=A0A5M6I873_9PROT|nr:hypothetical protein [Roseospira marina]KAA5604391.1 hypothetical protein F1188_16145 [Roseospira marina]MBB4315420.1 hypothetical protein [Roseospira marina]MBB5088435.1 hypothetical protein [Roseospira marina]
MFKIQRLALGVTEGTPAGSLQLGLNPTPDGNLVSYADHETIVASLQKAHEWHLDGAIRQIRTLTREIKMAEGKVAEMKAILDREGTQPEPERTEPEDGVSTMEVFIVPIRAA